MANVAIKRILSEHTYEANGKHFFNDTSISIEDLSIEFIQNQYTMHDIARYYPQLAPNVLPTLRQALAESTCELLDKIKNGKINNLTIENSDMFIQALANVADFVPDILFDMLNVGSPRLQQVIIHAIQRIGDVWAMNPLQKFRHDPDIHLRTLSTQVYQDILTAYQKRHLTAPFAHSTTLPKTDSRTVRVFISSTFRDMGAERDILVKNVFPDLRLACWKRGLELVDVDLRWGLTQEQAEAGEVVATCMNEIHDSDIFVCLLGHRYGWIWNPSEQPDATLREKQLVALNDLLIVHPWMKDYVQMVDNRAVAFTVSVTELEILYALQQGYQKIYVFLRDESYYEAHSDSSIAFFESDPVYIQQLNRLKNELNHHPQVVVAHYPTPEALAPAILTTLKAHIDDAYPEITDEYEAEDIAHRAFIDRQRKTYVKVAYAYTMLTGQIESSHIPLVLTGAVGTGKSALLANWAYDYQRTHPSVCVAYHNIGVTGDSTNWIFIQTHLIHLIRNHFHIKHPIPTGRDKIKDEFENWLWLAGQLGQVIIILDGLNYLKDHDNASTLFWLPNPLPTNIKIIASTTLPQDTDNPTEDELSSRNVLWTIERRSWRIVQIHPIEPPIRQQIITKFLQKYGKNLSDSQLHPIIQSRHAHNPLFLRVLADDLRVSGIYEKLDVQIQTYLHGETIDDLYEHILARYERDYTPHHPHLVRDMMVCLWASQYGLTEHELLALLGSEETPLPQAMIAPILNATTESLTLQSGRINLGNAYLKKAILERYIQQNPPHLEKTRRAIIGLYRNAITIHTQELFESQSKISTFMDKLERGDTDDLPKPDDPNFTAYIIDVAMYFALSPVLVPRIKRLIDEMVYQYQCLQDWDGLHGLLTDLPFIDSIFNLTSETIYMAWRILHQFSDYRAETAYDFVLDQMQDKVRYFSTLVGILGHVGAGDKVKQLWDKALEINKKQSPDANVELQITQIQMKVNALNAQNDVRGTIPLLKHAFQLAQDHNLTEKIIMLGFSLGLVLSERNYHQEALDTLDICLKVITNEPQKHEKFHISILLLKARVLNVLNQLDEMRTLTNQAVDLFNHTKLGEETRQGLLGLLSESLRLIGDAERAEHYHNIRLAYSLKERPGDTISILIEEAKHALIVDKNRAKQLILQARALATQAGKLNQVGQCDLWHGVILLAQDEMEQAHSLFERVNQSMAYSQLPMQLANMANQYERGNQLYQAISLLYIQEQFYRAQKHQDGMLTAMVAQGRLFHQLNQTDAVQMVYDRAQTMCIDQPFLKDIVDMWFGEFLGVE